jgi:hypothetical protein
MPKDKISSEDAILKAAQVKESEDLKNAARRLFSTTDGIKIGRAMMRACQIYSLEIDMLDNDKVRSMVSRTFLYKFFIIGMLTSQQRMAIETPDKKEK